MYRIRILICLLLLSAQTSASDLSITADHEVIPQGDTVTIRCHVENYRGSLVYWYKRQGDDDAVQFATNGEVNNIFSTTGRYSGSIDTTSGNNLFTFAITITGAVAEDSGDIGCKMKNSDAVYVRLSVVVPVSEMHLFALDAAGKVIKEFQDADQMEFTEGDQYYFQCTAAGGNPAPSIDLTLGGQDVNDHFTYEKTFTIEGSQPGLKQIYFQTKKTTKHPIVIHKDQNALDLRCTAGVEGTEPLTITVLPTLKFAPVLTCEKPEYVVPMYSRHFEVSCKVKSDPSADHVAIYWQSVDGKNRSLDEHSKTDGRYSMDIIPGDKPDEQIIKVHIERMYPQMFRKYTFLVKSSLGTDTKEVTLVEDAASGKYTGGAAKTSITSSGLALIAIIVSLMNILCK